MITFISILKYIAYIKYILDVDNLNLQGRVMLNKKVDIYDDIKQLIINKNTNKIPNTYIKKDDVKYRLIIDMKNTDYNYIENYVLSELRNIPINKNIYTFNTLLHAELKNKLLNIVKTNYIYNINLEFAFGNVNMDLLYSYIKPYIDNKSYKIIKKLYSSNHIFDLDLELNYVELHQYNTYSISNHLFMVYINRIINKYISITRNRNFIVYIDSIYIYDEDIRRLDTLYNVFKGLYELNDRKIDLSEEIDIHKHLH